MNLYELLNPSDPYTFEAPTLELAVAVCLTLGQGKFMLTEIGSKDRVNFVPTIFSGEDFLNVWCRDHFGVDAGGLIDRAFKERSLELADALASMVIGNRTEYLETLALIEGEEKRAAWRKAWHDRRRSSMNDIGSYAWTIAGRLRRKAVAA